jgi:hypothetical protein
LLTLSLGTLLVLRRSFAMHDALDRLGAAVSTKRGRLELPDAAELPSFPVTAAGVASAGAVLAAAASTSGVNVACLRWRWPALARVA